MPFTPLHFGPGALLHAVAPKHVSFLAFCAANIVIDVEPLYYMLSGQFPVHRAAHTYVGAAVVALLTCALWWGTSKLASVVRLPDLFGWRRLAFRQIAIGATLGSMSHVLLDSVMHSDLRPLAPFGDANPLLRLVSLGTLHEICVVAGVLGIALVGVRRLRVGRRRRAAQAAKQV